jgi:hypothetical protein
MKPSLPSSGSRATETAQSSVDGTTSSWVHGNSNTPRAVVTANDRRRASDRTDRIFTARARPVADLIAGRARAVTLCSSGLRRMIGGGSGGGVPGTQVTSQLAGGRRAIGVRTLAGQNAGERP